MDASTKVGPITAVIVERPTCLLCVAAKAGVTTLDVVRAIERIGKTIAVTITRGEDAAHAAAPLGPVDAFARPD